MSRLIPIGMLLVVVQASPASGQALKQDDLAVMRARLREEARVFNEAQARERAKVIKIEQAIALQQKQQVEMQQPVEIAEDVIDDQAVVGAEPRVRELLHLPNDYVDRYFFGGVRQYPQWLLKMDRCLDYEFQRAEAGGPLSEADKKRLRLAAKGDIKHLVDRIESCRPRFENRMQTREVLIESVNFMKPIHTEAVRGPFGSGSLFGKTLKGIRLKQQEAKPPGSASR